MNQIVIFSDYSAFGVQLSGRDLVKSGGREYRRGYQDSEEDDEVKGDRNSYTTEFRQFDPKLRLITETVWKLVSDGVKKGTLKSGTIKFHNQLISLYDSLIPKVSERLKFVPPLK